MPTGHVVSSSEAQLLHSGHVVEIGAQTTYVERGAVVLAPPAPAAAAMVSPLALARTLSGLRLRLWDSVLFGVILVIPRSVDVGAVVSLTTFPVEVWNADEFAHLCQSVGVTGSDGVIVSAGPTLPAFWPPFTSLYSTVQVGVDGDPNIDSLVAWVFPGFAGTDCHVLGVRLSVYPLSPEGDAGLEEGVGYLADVLTARNGTEQRVNLRQVAERTLAYRGLTTTPQESAVLLVKLLNQGQLLFTVPYWPDAVRPTADVAVGATTVTVDTTTRIFEVGGLVILWRDSQAWETGKITAVTPTTLTLRSPAATAWPVRSTFVVPLLPARLAAPAQVEDLVAGVKEITTTFRTEPTASLLGGTFSPPPPAPPPPLQMDVAPGGGWASGQSSVSGTIDVSPGLGYGLLVAQVCWNDPGGTTELVTSIVCDGAAMTLVPGSQRSVNNLRTAWYYTLAPAAGTRSVTATFSGSVTSTLALLSVFGVSQLAPFGLLAWNTGTSAFPNVIIPVGAGNISLFGCLTDQGSSGMHYNFPVAPTFAQVTFFNLGSSPNLMGSDTGYNLGTAGASVSITQTSSHPWGMMGIEIEAA